jgi:hypothetical protein
MKKSEGEEKRETFTVFMAKAFFIGAIEKKERERH